MENQKCKDITFALNVKTVFYNFFSHHVKIFLQKKTQLVSDE